MLIMQIHGLSGTVNHLKGKIDIGFDVKGSTGEFLKDIGNCSVCVLLTRVIRRSGSSSFHLEAWRSKMDYG